MISSEIQSLHPLIHTTSWKRIIFILSLLFITILHTNGVVVEEEGRMNTFIEENDANNLKYGVDKRRELIDTGGITTWTPLPNAVWTGRYFHASVLLGNAIYVMGGSNGGIFHYNFLISNNNIHPLK